MYYLFLMSITSDVFKNIFLNLIDIRQCGDGSVALAFSFNLFYKHHLSFFVCVLIIKFLKIPDITMYLMIHSTVC